MVYPDDPDEEFLPPKNQAEFEALRNYLITAAEGDDVKTRLLQDVLGASNDDFARMRQTIGRPMDGAGEEGSIQQKNYGKPNLQLQPPRPKRQGDKCENCGVEDSRRQKLQVCSGCKLALYCSASQSCRRLMEMSSS